MIMIMPSQIMSLILSTNNLILHTVFAISLTLLFSFFKIPTLLLYGLHTYIHPDDVNPGSNSGGLRAAIRRPGAIGSEQMNGKKGSNIVDKKGEVLNLVGYVGLSRSNFENLRLWCLLITGLLQILALRPNLQMFLNEAVFCWYQRLHGSKVPELDYSRAKVFLHNHYLCLVVLQFFAPAATVLLLLGLSPFDNNFLTDIQWACNKSYCSAFVKEVTLFMAWWIIFVWTVLSSAILALYRRGIFYVS